MGKNPTVDPEQHNRDAALESLKKDTQSLTHDAEATNLENFSIKYSDEAAAEPTPSDTSAAIDRINAAASKPAKKSRPQWFMPVMIVLAVLLTAGLGLVIWYFAYYNQPETAFFDALDHFGQAENVVPSGSAAFEHDDGVTKTSATVFFDLASTHLPNATNATLLLSAQPSAGTDDESETTHIKLTLGTVAIQDGAIYLQIGGIINSLKELGYTAENLSAFEGLYDTLELIDNEWWSISIEDVLNSIVMTETERNSLIAFADCLLYAGRIDPRAELVNLYREHRFFNIARTGNSSTQGSSDYQLTIIPAELAAFWNASYDLDAAEQVYACFDHLNALGYDLEATDFTEITAEEVADLLPSTYTFTATITDFGHQLQSLDFRTSVDSIALTFSLGFQYQSATVTEPIQYRPLTDLSDQLSRLYDNFFASNCPVEPVVSEDPGYTVHPDCPYCDANAGN